MAPLCRSVLVRVRRSSESGARVPGHSCGTGCGEYRPDPAKFRRLDTVADHRYRSGLRNTFDDVDRSPNGMPVKRSYATGRIGHLNHDKFPITAWQRKTFE